MMKRGQRILSMILALMLCVSMLPVSALALENSESEWQDIISDAAKQFFRGGKQFDFVAIGGERLAYK